MQQPVVEHEAAMLCERVFTQDKDVEMKASKFCEWFVVQKRVEDLTGMIM